MSNKQTCINFSYHTAKGLRDINEDAYWQGINKSNQILCVLCDGIGSQDDSQIASQITVKEFQDYFSKRRKIYNCKKMFHICLERAYKKITNCSNKDLNGKKIGTTLVVLFINNDQATCFNLVIHVSIIFHYNKINETRSQKTIIYTIILWNR
jgi:serine/threonine protein phosphatase PrpC